MKIWEDEKRVHQSEHGAQYAGTECSAQRAFRTDRLVDFRTYPRKETVNERGVFAPLEAVEVPEIEARRDEFKAADWMQSGQEKSRKCFSWRTGNKTGVGQTEGNIKYRCEPGNFIYSSSFSVI